MACTAGQLTGYGDPLPCKGSINYDVSGGDQNGCLKIVLSNGTTLEFNVSGSGNQAYDFCSQWVTGMTATLQLFCGPCSNTGTLLYEDEDLATLQHSGPGGP